MPAAKIDRVLAEFGLPIRAQVDSETKRSMRSCRENGYEKGRTMLAGIGREILSQQRLLDLEITRGGTVHSEMAPIQRRIEELGKERDKLDARYGTDRFEEMIRMDFDPEELKQENLQVLREN